MSTEGRRPGEREAGYGRLLALGLLLSGLLHAALFALVAFPRPVLPDADRRPDTFQRLVMPPSVEVPPAPGRVERPPEPVVREVSVREPVRPAGDTARLEVDVRLPDPPRVTATFVDGRPVVIPHDVKPLLEGRSHFRRRLERAYPARLRERGVEGVVRLRFYVDARGRVSRVRVSESSGHGGLDRAAREVADEMQFLPALNRDRAVGVWVSQKICFVTVDRRDEVRTVPECERRVVRGPG